MSGPFAPSLDPPAVAGPPWTGVAGLSVVVPCFNEAESLDRLMVELARLQALLAGKYDVEFVLVDDGSTDSTWKLLHERFGGRGDVQLLRHAANSGIAAAIRTGIAAARSEIVASLDADCTYEPRQLASLLPLLADDVDLVVASPYHPAGDVLGVPAWRLGLSRMASRLYGMILRNQLHTYTSCVRVYRKSSVVALPQTRGGFVGIVELVWQLDRRRGRIVECPAVLTVRSTGQSKMRVARTALAHLRLLAQAAWDRLAGRPPAPLVRPKHRAPLTTHHEPHLEPSELMS